jgi:hypothetical protein
MTALNPDFMDIVKLVSSTATSEVDRWANPFVPTAKKKEYTRLVAHSVVKVIQLGLLMAGYDHLAYNKLIHSNVMHQMSQHSDVYDTSMYDVYVKDTGVPND